MIIEENNENFDVVYDANSLIEAFFKSAKGSAWKQSVQRYEMNLLEETRKLQIALENGSYRQKPFNEFELNERGKTRDIKAFDISDRVVQRSFCDNILTPQLINYYIYDNGASIKGKGESFTRRRLVAHLCKFYRKNESNDGYVLKIDFSKFFDNIDHEKLFSVVLPKLKDDRSKALFVYMINMFRIDVSYLTDEEYEHFRDKPFNSLEYPPVPKEQLTGKKFADISVGIGGQPSQHAGLIYPSPIDNYCKCVKGLKYYGRYMDDIYIIHESKEYLNKLLKELIDMVREIGVFLNPKKTQIIKLSKGFIFMNVRYVLTDTGRILKIPAKKNFVRMRRKLKKLAQKVKSGEIQYENVANMYKGWRGTMRKYDCYNRLKTMDTLFNNLFINERKPQK